MLFCQELKPHTNPHNIKKYYDILRRYQTFITLSLSLEGKLSRQIRKAYKNSEQVSFAYQNLANVRSKERIFHYVPSGEIDIHEETVLEPAKGHVSRTTSFAGQNEFFTFPYYITFTVVEDTLAKKKYSYSSFHQYLSK